MIPLGVVKNNEPTKEIHLDFKVEQDNLDFTTPKRKRNRLRDNLQMDRAYFLCLFFPLPTSKFYIYNKYFMNASTFNNSTVLKIKGGPSVIFENFVFRRTRRIGFCDFESFNLTLLAKQGCRIIKDTNSLCAQVLKAKYFPISISLKCPIKSYLSYTWKSLIFY